MGTHSVEHDSEVAYRCLKCGASSALLLKEPVLRASHVVLKCLQCAHVQRMPRQVVEAAARLDSVSPLE